MGYAECVAFAGAAFGGAGRGGCAEDYFERDYTVVECVGVIGRFFCGRNTQCQTGRVVNPRPCDRRAHLLRRRKPKATSGGRLTPAPTRLATKTSLLRWDVA